MCGRYTVNTEEELIEMRAIIRQISIRMSREFLNSKLGNEAFPSMWEPVIDMKLTYRPARWGFADWRDSSKVIINARSETLASSRFFSPHLEDGRCLIPASSYFEWEKQSGGRKTKYRICSENGSTLFMAGVSRRYIDDGTKEIPTDAAEAYEFAVITRAAADNISFIHDRMPLILSSEDALEWLDPELETNHVAEMLKKRSIPVVAEKYG